MTTDDAPSEPTAVTVARKGIQAYNKRVAAYVAAVFGSTAMMVAAGELTQSRPLFWATFAVVTFVAAVGIPMMREKEHRTDRHTVREWESRGLRDEFDRFDRAAGAEVAEDPRMEAAAGMAERIRALQASDDATDEMVTRLEERLGRLITDEVAARGAVAALGAVGAAGVGTERLAGAVQHLEEEIARILSGMSDLYAALIESEASDGSDPASGLEVMSWLSAEAELARVARDAEAMRPAGVAAASATVAQTD